MKYAQLVLTLLLLMVSCSKLQDKKPATENEEQNWYHLLDADLSLWDNYLSFQHQPDYDGSPPRNEHGELIAPIGMNQPAYQVFSTLQEEGSVILRISGEYYGCLVTKEEFENYHLQLKYKWGEKKWVPRKEKLMDSGILYHSIGPPGAEFWRSWMLSQEFQIMEGHTGDYWSQATSEMDIRAYKPESNIDPMAHELQEYIPISMRSPYKNYCLRSGNYENPKEEWNTLDLYCYEDESLHVVNGEVVMILKNSRYLDDNGESVPLIKGKIQLQSEAAELFFKDIRIRDIASLNPD